MDHKLLIAKLLAQREVRVELEPGKAVTVRRPPEADMPRLRAGVTVPLLVEFTVGWEGITEADLLGAAVGASDPVPFDSELWAHVVADRTEWFKAAASALLAAVTAHIAARAEISGNSRPFST